MLYHGEGGLSDLNEVVERAVETLRGAAGGSFHSIVATGVSGLVVAAPVAVMLGMPLVVVRKEDDKSTHSGNRIENVRRLGSQWLFLDDFTSGGNTLKRVQTVIAEANAETRFAGAYYYNGDKLQWGESA